ncbi:hypothetical protein [Aristophania vespae]|uniref:hypothetical protein n=1 Tax=Aristophania vespae TaxID=2697033 RepID=UPI0023512122|nr:hypothetical protein [Aristophania vespae]UMM63090.1 hypothetical protein DM15PD_00440 [Aristophania vespae]
MPLPPSLLAEQDYITRSEFSERVSTVQQDVKTLEHQMIELRSMQNAQGEQLTQILENQRTQTEMLRKQGNLRSMFITGFSGFGGGFAAALIYMVLTYFHNGGHF